MSYILGVTVGPVQSYIEESRKLSDLHNSSMIISDIMKILLKKIKEKSSNMETIYPNYDINGSFDYSNYAIVEMESIVNMKEIQEELYNCFNVTKLEELKYDIREKFQIFWAFKQVKNKDYVKAYVDLTQLLRSLKNTYEFSQAAQDGGKKCLMCGKYNVAKLPNDFENKKRLDDQELCPLCLFKRMYGKKKNFSSVYSISVSKWLQNNKAELESLTKEMEKIFKPDNIDKYYSITLINHIIDVMNSKNELDKSLKFMIEVERDLNSGINLKEKLIILKNIKTSMSNIYGDYINKKVKQPTYEYCFIQMDVDNLGKWMSGKYIDSDNIKDLKEYQQFMSGLLLEFGRKLKNELNKNYCEVIYSGGDDFLAVIPNEGIIETSEKIDWMFENNIRNKIIQKYGEIDSDITYSMSITIAQCKDPMSYALNKTRIELDNVKKRFEKNNVSKNGVVINYIINNGKEITCYLRKNDMKRLFMLVKKFRYVNGLFSFSYINKFEGEFSKFGMKDINFDERTSFESIVGYELKRLFHRSKLIKEKNSKLEEYTNYFIEFMNIIINKNIIEVRSNHENVDFKNMVNVMKISKKLSEVYSDCYKFVEVENCESNKLKTM